MTALLLTPLGVSKLAAWNWRAAWKSPQVWTAWMTLLAFGVLALCSSKVYSPPILRLPKAEARARAERLLERLRPPDLADQPLAAYQVSLRCQPHPIDQAHWESAFLAPDNSHLYRLTLTGRGEFRFFAVYRRMPAAETAARSGELERSTALAVWRAFLLAEAGIAPPPTTEVPPVVRESPFPGRGRDYIRRWKTGHAQWPFVEVVFEGQTLQSLGLTQAEAPRPVEPNAVGRRFLVGLLALALWLPWLIVFGRGVLQGAMGSRTVFVTAVVIAASFLLLPSASMLTVAAPFAWQEPVITEEEFIGSLDTTDRVLLLLLGLVMFGAAALGVWAMSFVSLAVTESYDWKRQRQLLGDVYRLARRGWLPPEQVVRLWVGGLALALWVLAVEAVVEWQCGRPVLPWHDFSAWSQEFALGYWPGREIMVKCFTDVWIITVWLLPLAAFARDRLRDASAALAVGLGVGLIGLPIFANTGVTVIGYLLLLGGLLWTLFMYGWPTVVFGCALIGGLSPILWSLRFPYGFEPVFLIGGAAAAAPAALAWRRPPSRRTRNEAFDLAPRYVRDRLRLERWREDLDVRWLIHCNLLPPSGFRDAQRRVAAEYAHLPEQGREWFLILPLTEHRVGLAIGEVSGEGLEASLLMAAALAAIKSKAARHSTCPARVVERLNEFLSPRLQRLNAQVRLLYGIADVQAGTFTYCNAGYVPPVALKPEHDGGVRRPADLPYVLNPPLQSLTGGCWRSDTAYLERGSYLVLTSDWVGELCGLAPDAEATARRTAALLATFGELPAQEFPAAVVGQGRERLQQLLGAPLKAPNAEITVVCVEF
ncbi:MAG: SpoIIE family protein phosphatase [Chloracidobacterium sp.]|nr:SpoIIE family protein phosphatase [Chloracidobacterium sp.]MDW8217209.1 SpoIIE family protein phosphatase [Acidobacteriota bacterium]